MNTLIGVSGDDILSGNDGNDDLFGGPNNDIMYGDSGIDYFDCGLGKDKVPDLIQLMVIPDLLTAKNEYIPVIN